MKRHHYLATFYGTCSACGRPRSSPIHDMSVTIEPTVRCPFCGTELDAVGGDVPRHLAMEHHFVLHTCGQASDHEWKQEVLDELKEFADKLTLKLPNRIEGEWIDGGS